MSKLQVENENALLRDERDRIAAIQKDKEQEVSRIRFQMEELAQAKHELMMASISSRSSERECDTFNCNLSILDSFE